MVSSSSLDLIVANHLIDHLNINLSINIFLVGGGFNYSRVVATSGNKYSTITSQY
jgi:hypothetical protein